jgi:hypothetical protein
MLLRSATITVVSRRMQEAGLIAATIGSLVLVGGSVYILRAMRSPNGAQRPERTRERAAMLAGFVLIGSGLALQFFANVTRVFGS